MNTRTVTLRTALEETSRALAATSPSPRLDAEALLMHLYEIGRASLVTRANEEFDPVRYERFRQLVARRQSGEPVAYIIGTREFWSLPVKVTPAVLIPRPETELLVERALACIPRDAGDMVADLGTGSGAVALAIARERPRCRLVATDASIEAIRLACENAQNLGITNVEFCPGDWFTPLIGRRFHVIVSNPPYVRADDPHLQQGDLRFEPKAALVSGADGLDAIRRIVANARAHLHAGGSLLLEHGYDQAEAVAEILTSAGFSAVAHHRDLAGHLRVTEAES